MTLRDRLFTFSTLAMLVYLGFYIFGLAMGVYAPGDVPYFTIPAAVFAVIFVAQLVGAHRDSSRKGMTREERHLRETRGF